MNSREIKSHKEKLKLTKRQREIIVGKLLGDGHLESMNSGRTYRLKIEHSIKQKKYVDWFYQEFKEWILLRPKKKEQIVRGKVYYKYWVSTLSSGSFRFYAQQFYGNRKKVVPKLIHRWLTPLSLAVWFMDDGSIKSKNHRARIINTQGFERREVLRLIKVLGDKFGLKCKLRKQKEGYQIMILAESADQFAKLIKNYLHSSMKYKIKGLG
jgi:hypothetical protein